MMAAAIMRAHCGQSISPGAPKAFTTAYYRTYSEYGPASLDQKLFDYGDPTLGDRIDGEVFHF